MIEKILEASKFIESKISKKPEIGMILGSGLGVLGDKIENPTIVKYEEIPYFPKSTVAGHKGQLVIGELEGKVVIAMQGRFHYYEGYDINDVVFPVRVMKQLGIEKMIVTNAAGGSNVSFVPGDLMLITDHINFASNNPLIGKNYDELGARFPDMSKAYDREFFELARSSAMEMGLSLKEGTYMWLTGPTYETPAEIRMAQVLGADAVGMSTVPEVIAAVHMGIRVLGISCITNMAAGILDQPLAHEEVIETTERVKDNFVKLLKSIISKM